MNNITAGLLSGTITGVISFIIGSALWFAPWAVKLNDQSKDLNIWKNYPVRFFLPLVFIWGIIFTILMGVCFAIVKDKIPGDPIIQGLFFGITIWFFKNLPEAINNLLLINKPVNYTILELINSFVGLSVSGIILALFFKLFTKS